MKFSAGGPTHRWRPLVWQIAFLMVAFAAGRYTSTWHAKSTADSAKNPAIAESISAKYGNLSPTDALAKAKADLAKVLKTPGSRSRWERALIDFADSLDAGTLADLITDLKAKPVPDLDVLNFLFTRWAELNPSAALDSVESMHDFHKADLALSVLDTWALKDPAAALAASTRTQGDETLRTIAQENILTDMVKQNPQAAVIALRNLPGGSQSAFLYQYVFNAWAGLDPSAAATGALNLPPSSMRNEALISVADGMSSQNPAAALAWANSLPSSLAKNGAVDEVILDMSVQDPQSTANYALNHPNSPNGNPLPQAGPFSGSSNPLLGQIASIWAQQNPAALLTWADTNLTGETFDNAANAALKQMMATDPVAAAAALAQIPDPSVVSQNIPLLASQWSEQDPQAALTWAQALPTDNVALRNSAIAAVFNSWTTADPVAAAAYIQQNLTTDPAFGALATQVVNSWSQADPQAALTWAENLPQGAAQNSAVNAALTQLANIDPQTAWNDAQQLSGSSGNTAMVNVINAWAAQQPEQAAAVLQNMPAGSSLNTATADVAQNWLSQDPNAASQWINTLPQGAARDSAVAQIISSVGPNDPASAFTWATTIDNPTTRATQVVKLATQWSNQNPAAAAAAAQNALNTLTGLTPALQTSLQKIVAKAP